MMASTEDTQEERRLRQIQFMHSAQRKRIAEAAEVSDESLKEVADEILASIFDGIRIRDLEQHPEKVEDLRRLLGW